MTKHSKRTLEKLKQQRDKLNARIQQKESRLKQSERKIETRKKILVGSYFLDNATKENKINEIKTLMSNYLKRNSDRILFELDLLPED